MYAYGYGYPMISDSGGNTPTTIPNLGLWLKADAGVTLVSGAVDAWADQSGNGRNFSAPASANRPAYSNTLNGLPVLTFDGSTDYLAGNAASLSLSQNVGALTLFCIFSHEVASLSRVFQDSMNANPQLSRATIGTSATQYMSGQRRLESDTAQNVEGGTRIDEPVIFTSVINYQAANITSYLNGVEIANQAYQASGNTENNLSQRSRIAASVATTPAGFLSGIVAELVVYQRAISVEERNSVERYLSVKWGIAI